MLSNKLVLMSPLGKTAFMVATDAIALPFCMLAAMWLRLADFDIILSYGIHPYIWVPLATLLVFGFAGLYRAVTRFIDRHLLTKTIIGLAAVVLAAYGVSYLIADRNLPRNALMIYWLIAFAYIVTSRITARLMLRRHTGIAQQVKANVAIYGAGEAGMQLLRSIRSENKFNVACFFDDKRELKNRNVAGLRVFHTEQLMDIVTQLGINQIILAIPSASPQRRGEVMRSVSKAGVSVKTLSSLMELSDRAISTRAIRDVKIEDLLGRRPVPPMRELFAKCVHGQSVLVTGAGGSIGSELCRQIMTQSPRQLHLLDHSELALYTIQQELHSRFPDLALRAHLGSVCDARLVDRIMQEGNVDTVYHAAAYKHVTLVEDNMAEGIRNNVIGAQVITAAAEKHHVKNCVLISTDKAVRPTSIMGASKRIAEMVFQAAASEAKNGGIFCMVRFGNVLGSSGSVVPIFSQQIENGGPITVTHPDVTRYFMTIPEAAQLVMQAGAMAIGGGVFVLDMGDPVKILDMARTMIELAGLTEKTEESDGDIEIKIVGLRPGEKLFEELIIGGEPTASVHPRIMTTWEHFLGHQLLTQRIDELMMACRENDCDRIKSAMRLIVSEYAPDSQRASAHISQQPTMSSVVPH